MQKYVNLVDLVKSFPTSTYLQTSASIQPRTSLTKFGGKFNSLFIRLLTRGDCGPPPAPHRGETACAETIIPRGSYPAPRLSRFSPSELRYPVGGIAVPRSSSLDQALSLAIMQNEDDLLKGAYRTYPFLKKSEKTLESPKRVFTRSFRSSRNGLQSQMRRVF